MAKKKGKKKVSTRRKRGGSQRAKFKKAASTCRAQVAKSGVTPMSREMWRTYGKCMKREL